MYILFPVLFLLVYHRVLIRIDKDIDKDTGLGTVVPCAVWWELVCPVPELLNEVSHTRALAVKWLHRGSRAEVFRDVDVSFKASRCSGAPRLSSRCWCLFLWLYISKPAFSSVTPPVLALFPWAAPLLTALLATHAAWLDLPKSSRRGQGPQIRWAHSLV